MAVVDFSNAILRPNSSYWHDSSSNFVPMCLCDFNNGTGLMSYDEETGLYTRIANLTVQTSYPSNNQKTFLYTGVFTASGNQCFLGPWWVGIGDGPTNNLGYIIPAYEITNISFNTGDSIGFSITVTASVGNNNQNNS